jgi:biotin carboxylase
MQERALILVEGASNGPLYVQAARDLGLHPITLSADPDQYHYLSTESAGAVRVDTTNLEALIGECSRLRAIYNIAGITSTQEAFYATVGKLCRYFDLPGPDPVSVERCRDKFTQRQLLARAGVPVPTFRMALNAEDVDSAVAAIGLPVIVKPTVGIGSSGVRLCRDAEEIAEHTAHLLGGSHISRSAPRVLVEEFAEGAHYVAQAMGNEVIAIEAAEFHRARHFVFREVTCPAKLKNEEHAHLVEIAQSCLQALGLGWGPTTIELRWTKRGPIVIDVSPRLAGPPDPHLIELAYGVDLVTEHVNLVIDGESTTRKKRSHVAAARFLNPARDGILDSIKGINWAIAIPGVIEVKLYIAPKCAIVRKGDVSDLIGHVIAVSLTHAETKTILQRAVKAISWSITAFPLRDQVLSDPVAGNDGFTAIS